MDPEVQLVLADLYRLSLLLVLVDQKLSQEALLGQTVLILQMFLMALVDLTVRKVLVVRAGQKDPFRQVVLQIQTVLEVLLARVVLMVQMALYPLVNQKAHFAPCHLAVPEDLMAQ